MRKFLFGYRYIAIFIILGIIGGFLYWRFIGCSTGSCPITSNWHTSTLMGGVMGYLTGSIIFDKSDKKPS